MEGEDYQVYGSADSSAVHTVPWATPTSATRAAAMRPHAVPPLGGPEPPLSHLVQIEDVTARPPRTHLAPLHPHALSATGSAPSTGAAQAALSPSFNGPTLSPIRGARPSCVSTSSESPSKLQDERGADGAAIVGSLAMVARRRRQSSQMNTNSSSPSRQLPSPESERATEAYVQLYGHQPVPPEPSSEPMRPRRSISPEAAPAHQSDFTAFDLLDPDTDGSPAW